MSDKFTVRFSTCNCADILACCPVHRPLIIMFGCVFVLDCQLVAETSETIVDSLCCRIKRHRTEFRLRQTSKFAGNHNNTLLCLSPRQMVLCDAVLKLNYRDIPPE